MPVMLLACAAGLLAAEPPFGHGTVVLNPSAAEDCLDALDVLDWILDCRTPQLSCTLQDIRQHLAMQVMLLVSAVNPQWALPLRFNSGCAVSARE